MLRKIAGVIVTTIVILGFSTNPVEASQSNHLSYSDSDQLNNWQEWFHSYFNDLQDNQGVVINEDKQEQSDPNQKKKTSTDEDTEQDASELKAFEEEIIELTNQERTDQGLDPLVVDQSLSSVAREKSNDMAVNDYFSHHSPTYGSPFDMMQAFDIDYMAAGENIAKGQQTPEDVVQAWMNSEGHRANILNKDFTHIGVGFIEDGYHWTQMFITR
ncbi:CAP domain-containing protein [Amphibacillus cookii]|uniref:CAP domain-containing protein n=1 Tax=Amphibacillus cookii TaxID=767787 RepID=UPI00195E35B9|nr:CAP domain-containing protein [Amphibacillus cookii]MBM7542581.1 putative YkwD family protein [Amphibacillus cookii]